MWPIGVVEWKRERRKAVSLFFRQVGGSLHCHCVLCERKRLEPSQRHIVIPSHKREDKMAHPATEKRGGNPDVKHKARKPKDPIERKLEQGLEESMTGSDPVSVAQPAKTKHDEKKSG